MKVYVITIKELVLNNEIYSIYRDAFTDKDQAIAKAGKLVHDNGTYYSYDIAEVLVQP